MTVEKQILLYLDALDDIGWSKDRFLLGNKKERPTPHIESLNFEIPFVSNFFSTIFGVREEFKTLDKMYFFPGYIPYSFVEAAEDYKNLFGRETWREGLFPMLTDYMGSYLSVDCHTGSDTKGAVFECLENYFPVRQFPSIQSMLTVFLKSVGNGAIYLESGPFLELDDEKYYRTCQAELPDIPFWHENNR